MRNKLILLLCLSISGCSYMHINRWVPTNNVYLKSQNQSSLVIPAGLSDSKITKTYGIPSVNPGPTKVSIVPPGLDIGANNAKN
jgi:uncharacterized lipoprotein